MFPNENRRAAWCRPAVSPPKATPYLRESTSNELTGNVLWM